MNIRDTVRSAKNFKSLNTTQQAFTLSKKNLEKIQHGLTVAKNIGLDKWKAMCGFTQRNISIVEEIRNNQMILEEIAENQPKKSEYA